MKIFSPPNSYGLPVIWGKWMITWHVDLRIPDHFTINVIYHSQEYLTFSTLPPMRDFVKSPNLYPFFLPPPPPSSPIPLSLFACSTTEQVYLRVNILLHRALLFVQNNDCDEWVTSTDEWISDALPDTSRHVNAKTRACRMTSSSSGRRCRGIVLWTT